jgi:hypothetical protein
VSPVSEPGALFPARPYEQWRPITLVSDLSKVPEIWHGHVVYARLMDSRSVRSVEELKRSGDLYLYRNAVAPRDLAIAADGAALV